MQGPKRECKNCGHDCHCYAPNCEKCVNDVCTKCNCKPDTDARSWDDYLK